MKNQIVVPTPPMIGVGLPLDLMTSVRESAARQLAEWGEGVVRAGLKSETHLSPATPSLAIVATVEEVGADLVVMGTRGLSGLKHVMLGSVAERTVRTAPCAVLTVKAGS